MRGHCFTVVNSTLSCDCLPLCRVKLISYPFYNLGVSKRIGKIKSRSLVQRANLFVLCLRSKLLQNLTRETQTEFNSLVPDHSRSLVDVLLKKKKSRAYHPTLINCGRQRSHIENAALELGRAFSTGLRSVYALFYRSLCTHACMPFPPGNIKLPA